MSWHYLQAQAGESSGACCAGGEPWRPSKLKNIPGRFCCNGRLTESYLDSLCGTMCARSTGTRGGGESMSSAADSLVRTSAPPEKAPGSTGNAPGCGASSRELSVKFDPATSSWKTHQCLWEEDLPESSVTLPRWGSMRAGVLSEHTTPARLTKGTESGLWPTPKASAAGPDFAKLDRSGTGVSLQTAVAMWTTPAARDAKGANSREHCKTNGTRRKHMDQLPNAVAHPDLRSTYPTPKTNGFCGGSGAAAKVRQNEDLTDAEKRSMLAGNGGQLNPDWVEWLMGWPIGWTDLKPLATDRFRRWLRSHGKYLCL